jgi:hypothetical protein
MPVKISELLSHREGLKMRKYFILFLLMPLSVVSYELDEKLKCPGNIRNSGECAEYLENSIIHTLNFAKRVEDTLYISTRGGKKLTLQSKKIPEESSCLYYLVDFLRDIDMVVVYCQYWEGDTFFAIHLIEGKPIDIHGYPNVSPDKKQFVTATIDLEAGYTPNTISIYGITGQGYSPMWSIKPEGWGARDLEWKNDRTIRFNKTTLDSSFKYKKVPAAIVKISGKWQLKLNEKPE